MNVCKFFLQGTCRFGNSCKFLHQLDHNYGRSTSVLLQPQQQPPQSGSNVDSATLVKSVINDMTSAEKGGQWLLTSYAPFKEKSAFPGFEDHSMEEVRFLFYEAVKSGSIEQYKQNLQQLLQQQIMRIKSLQNPSPDAVNILKQIYNNVPSASGSELSAAVPNGFGGANTGQSVFGGPTLQQNSFTNATNSNVFGGGAPAVATSLSTNSFFGQSQPTVLPQAASPIKSFFGQSQPITISPPTNSIFGQSQPVAGLAQSISPPNTLMFGQSHGSTNMVQTMSPPVNSMFGQTQVPPVNTFFSSAQPSVANTIFGQSQPSMQMPTTSNQIFAQSQPAAAQIPAASSNSIFGQPPQGGVFTVQPPAQSIFGGAVPNQSMFVAQAPPLGLAPNQPFGNNHCLPQPNQNPIVFSSGVENQSVSVCSESGEQPISFKVKTAENVYSRMEDLNEDEKNWFQSDNFELSQIPEKPPTYDMCFKT